MKTIRLVCVDKMNKWWALFCIAFFAYLSGFIAESSNKQLFLRTIAQPITLSRAPSLKSSEKTFNAQVAVLGIGTEKNNASSSAGWGKSQQIGPHQWTINVGKDAHAATPQELFLALNSYRQRNGREVLQWDDKLGSYAQQRAEYFTKQNHLDEHAGFNDFVNNQDGFHKLGFVDLGENASIGYRLEAVHLIEWVYAGDVEHNDNQLSAQWSSVGIGIDGMASDFIFGGTKL